jgi:hypothetical protein
MLRIGPAVLLPVVMGMALGTTGCAGVPPCCYVMLEYRAGAEYGLHTPRLAVKPSPTYLEKRRSWNTVAVRLPEYCLQESAAQANGNARNPDKIFQSECGVYMAEVERALSEKGLKVLSWNALNQLEQRKKISTYEAAQELGADIVFMFNSLETSRIKAGEIAGATLRFYQSDEEGAKGSPVKLDDKERGWFKSFLKERMGSIDPEERISALSATLDTTAVLIGPGNEAVWFYQNIQTEPVKTHTSSRILFAQRRQNFWPVNPYQQSQAEIPKDTSQSEEMLQSQRAARPEDEYAKERLELMRKVVMDFVGKFRSETGG